MLTKYFPIWAILFSLIAYVFPSPFEGMKSAIVPLLSIIMLLMGLTLSLQDFAKTGGKFKAISLALLLQYSVMPITALTLSYVFGFSPEVATGFALLGSVAGGTASNVMCFLAKGDVALSVTLTALSTLIGVFFTPILVELLVGQSVDVDVFAMFVSLLKIVLIPVFLGVMLNTFFSEKVHNVKAHLPKLTISAIIFIIMIIVALNAQNLTNLSLLLLLGVVTHNAVGLASGYFSAKLAGLQEAQCRTLAFEVGLQNSGLAVALAIKFFSPLSALPAALFSIWHNVSGATLASYWSSRSVK